MSKKYDEEKKPGVLETLGAFALVGAGFAAGRAVFLGLSDAYDTKVEPQLQKWLKRDTEKTEKTEE